MNFIIDGHNNREIPGLDLRMPDERRLIELLSRYDQKSRSLGVLRWRSAQASRGAELWRVQAHFVPAGQRRMRLFAEDWRPGGCGELDVVSSTEMCRQRRRVHSKVMRAEEFSHLLQTSLKLVDNSYNPKNSRSVKMK
jgi:hypothetical protein